MAKWNRIPVFGAVCLCVAMAADEKDAARLPDGAGKETVARVCIDCHPSSNFRRKRLDADHWSEQVSDMIERGAKISEADYGVVVDYLVQNFGPDSKLHVNTAPMIELKSVLGITVDEAQSLVNYREANGDFKQWEDLQKVPGVDAKKIEPKKDMIAYGR